MISKPLSSIGSTLIAHSLRAKVTLMVTYQEPSQALNKRLLKESRNL